MGDAISLEFAALICLLVAALFPVLCPSLGTISFCIWRAMRRSVSLHQPGETMVAIRRGDGRGSVIWKADDVAPRVCRIDLALFPTMVLRKLMKVPSAILVVADVCFVLPGDASWSSLFRYIGTTLCAR